jgi:hypothetical protein
MTVNVVDATIARIDVPTHKGFTLRQNSSEKYWKKLRMRQNTFNTVILLLIAIPFLTLGFSCSSSRKPSLTEDTKTSPAEEYRAALGLFQPLNGTPYLMSSVTYQGWRSNKFSSDESYDSEGQIHNLVFLDTNTLESQRLFETNTYVIVQTDKYSQTVNGKDVTQWLVHQILKADTDGNKRLDRNDSRTLAISSANGKKYVEVLTGITEIFGLTMNSPGKLVVVYGKEGVKTSSIVDLDKRIVIATKSIVDLGSEVK